MESLEHAMKRDAPIIAEYLGGAVNCDAYHMTDPRSDGLGVSSCIKRSLEDAGVAPEEVITFSFFFHSYKTPCSFALLSLCLFVTHSCDLACL
jgi:3-oxoacyl-(acyl-carrier-protein) synthase